MSLDGHSQIVLDEIYPSAAIGVSLNRLQADLTALTRKWALSEVAATIARELDGPLTSLLRHLKEIKQGYDGSAVREPVPAPARSVVEDALQATERVRSIVAGMTPDALAPQVAARAESAGIIRADATGLGNIAARPSGHSRLTPREREVLAIITDGISNKGGGHQLGISTRTFEVHRAHIMEKLGARNAADLVRITLSGARRA